MNSRQQTILQMVIDQGQVSVTDLAKATGVSEVTIRQDLNTLEKLSYLRRAHAQARRFMTFETNLTAAAKRELAGVYPSLTDLYRKWCSNAHCRTLGEQKKNVASSQSAATLRIC